MDIIFSLYFELVVLIGSAKKWEVHFYDVKRKYNILKVIDEIKNELYNDIERLEERRRQYKEWYEDNKEKRRQYRKTIKPHTHRHAPSPPLQRSLHASGNTNFLRKAPFHPLCRCTVSSYVTLQTVQPNCSFQQLVDLTTPHLQERYEVLRRTQTDADSFRFNADNPLCACEPIAADGCLGDSEGAGTSGAGSGLPGPACGMSQQGGFRAREMQLQVADDSEDVGSSTPWMEARRRPWMGGMGLAPGSPPPPRGGRARRGVGVKAPWGKR
jgi:hypothetical protein